MGPFRSVQWIRAALKLTSAVEIVVVDSVGFCAALFRNHMALAAENLFLRKQLGLFQEREKKAARTTAADRIAYGPGTQMGFLDPAVTFVTSM